MLSSSTFFKHLLLRNHWANQSQISYGASIGMGEWKFAQMVLVTWPRWPPCPCTVKNLKNLLLWNQKADDLESWYAWSGVRVLPTLLKWWPWVDLDLFYRKVKIDPLWENGKTIDFSETIVIYGSETSNSRLNWQKVSVDIKTLSPGGCMPPAWGLYTCIKSWKKLSKVRLQRDFFETCNKWVKW